MEATLHFVLGCDDGYGAQSLLVDDRRFCKDRDVMGVMEQVKDDVDMVDLHADVELEVVVLYELVEGISRLQATRGEYEVVPCQFVESDRKSVV